MRLLKERELGDRCLSCAIVSGAEQVDNGSIVETTHFHAHQDVAYPVPGLAIVASRRHVKCLDELTLSEVQDLSALLLRIRRAQRDALGVEHVYYFYNEDTSHHFHVLDGASVQMDDAIWKIGPVSASLIATR